MPPKVPCRITETVMKLIATTCWYTCQWWVLKTEKCDFNRGFLLWLGCIECQKHSATCRGYSHLFWNRRMLMEIWITGKRSYEYVRVLLLYPVQTGCFVAATCYVAPSLSMCVSLFVCCLFARLNPLQYQMYCKAPFSNCRLWTDILNLYSK